MLAVERAIQRSSLFLSVVKDNLTVNSLRQQLSSIHLNFKLRLASIWQCAFSWCWWNKHSFLSKFHRSKRSFASKVCYLKDRIVRSVSICLHWWSSLYYYFSEKNATCCLILVSNFLVPLFSSWEIIYSMISRVNARTVWKIQLLIINSWESPILNWQDQ